MAGFAIRSTVKVATAATSVAVVVAAGLALAGGSGDGRAEAQARGPALKQIGSFDSPVYVAHVPRRPRLLYVVEQPGTIRVLRRGRKLARPFLNIRKRVRSFGEAGLLSIAFHPRYPRNRSFFIYYVDNNGDVQVERLRSRRGRPARANPRSRRTVLTIPHPGLSHFGGQLQFGPGGLLFLATGDGGGGDPDGNAQNRDSLLGKLLRIRPRPQGGHRSPRTNPFVGLAGRNQIYALGLRNPWRFSFDRRTGDVAIADVGQHRWEEINHTTRGEARGANFGWNCREGPEEYEDAPAECARVDRSEFTDPIHAYRTQVDGTRAITGGYVARGRGAPVGLRGRYVYGDFGSGEIRSLDPNAADPSATDRSTGLTVTMLSSFGEGRRGAIYATSLSGPVHRIVSR